MPAVQATAGAQSPARAIRLFNSQLSTLNSLLVLRPPSARHGFGAFATDGKPLEWDVMPNEVTIIYERGADGWWVATIPEVPGAFSQGQSKAEARANVLDAMTELMAARREMALT